MTEPKVVVSAQIPREQREQLERMAADDERTVSALVRYAVAEYVERQHVPSALSATTVAPSASSGAASSSRQSRR